MKVTSEMLLLFGLFLALIFGVVSSDRLSDVHTRMAAVNADNCATKSKADLTLPVSDHQQSSSLMTEAKRLALNRAIFYTITNQKLNTTSQFSLQPDLYYTYLSTAVSQASSPRGVLATALYYDQNKYYANFYYNLYLNMTLKLFAPYASRDDRAIKVKDDSLRNYTRDDFKTGDWFSQWLPDNDDSGSPPKDILSTVDSESGTERSVFIVRGSNPVKVTQPYFDCGRTNKWIVTVSSPVVDYLPRYTPWHYLRRARYVAVSTVDVDYTSLDISQTLTSSGASSSSNPASWVTSDLVQAVLQVSASDCTSHAPAMVLSTTPQRYVFEQLITQIRPGYRLAQLISGSLQQQPVSPGPDFLIKGPQDINTHLLSAEIEAIVFSDDQIAAAELVVEKEEGQIFSYFARRSVNGVSINNRRLVVRQNHWTSDMLDARRAEVWTGGNFGENMVVKPSAKPFSNAGSLEEMPPWSFQGPDDVHTEAPEYSCVLKAWVEKVSSAIIGPDSQSNLAIRGEVIVYITLPVS